MNIGILWFSPHASIGSPALDAEAKQVLEENAAFVAAPPEPDAVIVKATVSVGGGGFNMSRTASFVFAKNNEGTWEYTEKYDNQFAKARL